ncbi:MAG: C25 family cysteine peptidase, partial [Myxococcota bacterium]
GEGAVALQGFERGSVNVWDVTGGAPTIVEDVVVTPDGATFSTGFRDAEFVAFSEPLSISGLTPLGRGDLREETPSAEYVIIAHGSLVESARTLADYRASQGLSTLVLDVREVYDAYGDGVATSAALEAFIRDAYRRWDVPPRYLFLVGDGTFDPRGRLGFSDNLITPRMYSSASGKFASDSSMGDLGVEPGYSVAVGRLPAHTPEEVSVYVEKVQAFETSATGLADAAFILADNPDDGGDFDLSLELALESFGQGLQASGVVVNPTDLDDARDQLFAAIDLGTRYLHFIGHGGLDGLAGERILAQEDITSLANAESPFVLLAAACLLGRFDVPGIRALSEELLLTPGVGAAAVFASAGLEANERSTALGRLMGELIGETRHRRIGSVVAEASTLAPGLSIPRDSLRLHTLLGDPALMLTADASEWAPYERPTPPPTDTPSLPIPTEPEGEADAPASTPPAAGGETTNQGSPTERPTMSASGCQASPPPGWLLFAWIPFWVRRRSR